MTAVRAAYDLKPGDTDTVMAFPFLAALAAVSEASAAEEDGNDSIWLIDAAIEKAVLVLTGLGYPEE